MPVKTYRGIRTDKGMLVTVETGTTDYVLPLRLDLCNHSPTGFEIGYGGSGPAQLALAILADALDAGRAHSQPSRRSWEDNERDPRTIAVRWHQDFKRKFIATLPRDSQWAITQRDVLDFVATKGAKL